ncbi:MAG: gliding motility lipoprotein GldH [Bacteroides sp.]|nr:gliding motility lipoprotein GldH [Bacteroides sp.]
MNKGLTCLLFLLLLSACGGNISYHSYQPVPNGGWRGNDTLFYPLPDSIEPGNYTVQLGIRHLESYPYRDIWLEVSHNLQDSTTYQKDTLHLYLADTLGDWYGHGIGGLLQYTADSVLEVHLQEKSNGSSFHINHLMNDTLLRSIYDVGIRLQHLP